jgi:SAM-dependent methyltransferase
MNMDSIKCPSCEAADPEIYLEAPEAPLDAAVFGSSRMSVSPGTILRCRNCGCGFRRNPLAQAELAQLYREMDTKTYDAESAGRARTALTHLALLHRFAEPGRLLDVGCASGLFLDRAATAGWEVAGVEPSEQLFQQARAKLASKGLVLKSVLEEADLPLAGFDAVTLWDVLEHVADPLGILQRCHSLLKPGGMLILNVPDLQSLQARLLGRRWPLLLPEHLIYFTRRSLRICGEKAGLSWVAFGRRSANFSLQYVAYRLSQHAIPGARLASRIFQSRAGLITIPVKLGETYGVWKKPSNS